MLKNVLANQCDDQIGHLPTATSLEPNLSQTETMKALVFHGKKQVSVEQVPKPLITDPTDCIVRVTATTACGSDTHLYLEEIPNMKDGDVLGHEAMGIVDQVGDQVKNLSIGDRVVISFDISCGQCSFCKRGEFTCCDNTNNSRLNKEMYGGKLAATFGYSHLTGGVMGCQAEFIRVPFADVNCYKVPTEMTDQQALYLSDVCTTSLHAVQLGDMQSGKGVAVWGLGAVGLLCCQWAKVLGASSVVAIEPCEFRRKHCHDKLNIPTIDPAMNDVYEELEKYFPEGPDICIDAAGFRYNVPGRWTHKIERALGMETDSGDIVSQCIYAVRKGGNVVLIGDYVGYTNHFPIGAMMEKHLTVRGGQSYTQALWKTAEKYILENKFDPTICLSHQMKFEDLPKIYEMMHEKEGNMIKPFVIVQ